MGTMSSDPPVPSRPNSKPATLVRMTASDMGQEDVCGYIFSNRRGRRDAGAPREHWSLRLADAARETKRPGFNPALKHITTNENYCEIVKDAAPQTLRPSATHGLITANLHRQHDITLP